MASRAELDRKAVVNSGSPLGRHSLNQRKLGYERAGGIKVFGKEAEKSGSKARRESLRKERRQALYDSMIKIFNGKVGEEDLVAVFLYSKEFEIDDKQSLNASIIDFTDLRGTEESFGEPEFFRKNKI